MLSFPLSISVSAFRCSCFSFICPQLHSSRLKAIASSMFGDCTAIGVSTAAFFFVFFCCFGFVSTLCNVAKTTKALRQIILASLRSKCSRPSLFSSACPRFSPFLRAKERGPGNEASPTRTLDDVNCGLYVCLSVCRSVVVRTGNICLRRRRRSLEQRREYQREYRRRRTARETPEERDRRLAPLAPTCMRT